MKSVDLKKQKIFADLIKRAKNIEQKGIKPLDALHIASAEFLKSDYMITTEADIVQKYKTSIIII